MSNALLPLYLFVLLSLTSGAAVLFVLDLRAKRRKRAGAVAGEQEPELPRLVPASALPPAGGWLKRLSRWFDRTVAEGDTETSPDVAFLFLVAAAVAVGGAVFVWRDSAVATIVGMLAGMSLVVIFFVNRRARRMKAIREQLPDVMETLARAVRAGQSLDQAIQMVGDTTNKPLGVEFLRCARHLEMGLSLGTALRSLTRRAPLTETRIFATSLMVQRQAGGNLPITLERLASVIRDRLSFQRQFSAATAAARFASLLIVLAVVFVATYLWIWQSEYIGTFMRAPGGLVLLIVAVVLQGIGLAWVIRLLRTNY